MSTFPYVQKVSECSPCIAGPAASQVVAQRCEVERRAGPRGLLGFSQVSSDITVIATRKRDSSISPKHVGLQIFYKSKTT